MTNAEREQIFSKDYLTGNDIELLLGVDRSTASSILQWIKRRSDRLGIRGKVMVQDYLDAFSLPSDRYIYRPDDGRTNG